MDLILPIYLNLPHFFFLLADSTSPDADENDTPVIPRVPSPKQLSNTSSSEKEPNATEKEPNATTDTTTELPVSDNELPNLEEVTPKIAQVSLEEAKDIPLPTVTSDDDEFHEASESVSLSHIKSILIRSFFGDHP